MSGVRRSRWAAIGAAVAVSLGAGGLGLARASTGVESSFVSVTPARVLDTRTGLGLAGPLVSPTPRVLQVTGSIARPDGSTAVVVPPGATAVVLNVTVVGPTAAGFLSVRPDGTPGAPETSNLNFSAGDIIPNAVTVALPASGAIELTYNAFGAVGPTTDVLADVTGFYVASSGGGGAKGDKGDTGAPGKDGATSRLRQLNYNGLTKVTPGSALQQMRVIGSFAKSSSDSVVRLTWQSHVRTEGGFVCGFQVHVNGLNNQGTTTLGGTMALSYAAAEYVPVSSVTVFEGLPAGNHEISIWVRAVGEPTCWDNPGNWTRSVLIEEFDAEVLSLS